VNQKEFRRLRNRYVKAVWKRIDRRTDFYVQIETASRPKIALNAAKKYYRECVRLNRELERFISQLEKSN
jgi:hypothetical protein